MVRGLLIGETMATKIQVGSEYRTRAIILGQPPEVTVRVVAETTMAVWRRGAVQVVPAYVVEFQGRRLAGPRRAGQLRPVE